jgi:hypothetical protein
MFTNCSDHIGKKGNESLTGAGNQGQMQKSSKHQPPSSREFPNINTQNIAVTDLRYSRVNEAELQPESVAQPLTLPPSFPAEQAAYYPWSQPIVFRSGRYLVHRVTDPVKELYNPWAKKGAEGK